MAMTEWYPKAKLCAILTTHWHWDHSAGNAELLKATKRGGGEKLKVYGSEVDFRKGSWWNAMFTKVDHFVRDGDSFQVGRMHFGVISARFHTKGSVLYLFDPARSLPSTDDANETSTADSSDLPPLPSLPGSTSTLETGSTVSNASSTDARNLSASIETDVVLVSAVASDEPEHLDDAGSAPNSLEDDDGEVVREGSADPEVLHRTDDEEAGLVYIGGNEGGETRREVDGVEVRESPEVLRSVSPSPARRAPAPPSSLFSGDSLFVSGCGRFFEGDEEGLYDLIRRRLPEEMNKENPVLTPQTLLWPGHDYAYSNLAFARELEPGNMILQLQFKEAEDALYHSQPFLPTPLESEFNTNPYFRLRPAMPTGRRGRKLQPVTVRRRRFDASVPELLRTVESKAAAAGLGLKEVKDAGEEDAERKVELGYLRVVRSLKDSYVPPKPSFRSP
ncbi:beta-lactamase-like protein [Cladochytrium replicatum]|nr:beta-lactamase-like protein [Cladochytrium replicatum]